MTEELFVQMQEIFHSLGAAALGMSHYDLAQHTDIKEPHLWKRFLTEPTIADWIKSEIQLIQESELKKMIQGAARSRSVGQAQLMNTLAKLGDDKSVKEGPIFIYTYIPLNPEQAKAENVQILTSDPFIRGGE